MLTESSEAVTKLMYVVNEQMVKPLEAGSVGQIERFAVISECALQVARLLELFWFIIFNFRSTLKKHLKWLETIFHLERTSKTPLLSSDPPTSQPSSQIPPSSPPSSLLSSPPSFFTSVLPSFLTSALPSALPSSPPFPPISHVAQSSNDIELLSDEEGHVPSTPFEDDERDVVSLDEKKIIEFTENLASVEIGQDEDEEDEEDDPDQIQELLRKGWHVAAEKYLDVICLYPKSLFHLESSSMAPAVVPGLDISVISARPEFRDNVMLPVTAVLEDTYLCRNDAERSELTKFIMNHSHIGQIHHKWATEPPNTELEVPFNGTWHCETLLLSLVIAKVGCIE
jgi:hypothetical protein